jgi:quaternary ammonium compound-resistance protein SugE
VNRAWVYLVIAGLLEFVWAVGLKSSQGLTKPGPSIVTVIAALLSFYLLGLAMRDLPVGTAYAVWTGIGAVGAAIIGMVFLGESRDAWRLLSLALIITGLIGLKVTSKPETPPVTAGDVAVIPPR